MDFKAVIERLYQYGKDDNESKKLKRTTFAELPSLVFLEHNGTMTERKVEIPPRSHTVETVADLILAVETYGDEGGEQVSAWVSDGQVVALLDDKGMRKSRVTLGLIETKVMKLLRKLNESHSSGAIDQVQFDRILRREFRDSPSAPAIRAAIKMVKFASSETQSGVVGHGESSLGVQVERKAAGAGDIPEGFSLPVQVFLNEGETYKFTFDIDIEIDTVNKKFIVRPLPDQVDKALQGAMESIATRLEKSMTVFNGQI